MVPELERDERLYLMKILCAFVGADDALRNGEHRFVDRMSELLEIDAEGREEVAGWLRHPPSLASVDLSELPLEHRSLFLDAISAAIFADGEISREEQELFQRLRQ